MESGSRDDSVLGGRFSLFFWSGGGLSERCSRTNRCLQ